jgi:hypothetical protein
VKAAFEFDRPLAEPGWTVEDTTATQFGTVKAPGSNSSSPWLYIQSEALHVQLPADIPRLLTHPLSVWPVGDRAPDHPPCRQFHI